MKVTLCNYELTAAANFLGGMVVPANKSRPVTKFKKLVLAAVDDLHEEQRKILEQYSKKDDEGNPVPGTNGRIYDLDESRERECNKEIAVLSNEKVVFDGGMHAKVIPQLYGLLKMYTEPISGQDAEIYDRLVEEFEKEGKKDA